MNTYTVIYQTRDGYYGSQIVKTKDAHSAVERVQNWGPGLTPLFVTNGWEAWRVVPERSFSLRVNGPMENQ